MSAVGVTFVASLAVTLTGTLIVSLLPSSYVTSTSTSPFPSGIVPVTFLDAILSPCTAFLIASSVGFGCWSWRVNVSAVGVTFVASLAVTLIGTFTFSLLPSLYVTLTTATPDPFGILPTISFLAIFVPLTAPNTWSFVCFGCWSLRVKVFAVGVYFVACVNALKTTR